MAEKNEKKPRAAAKKTTAAAKKPPARKTAARKATTASGAGRVRQPQVTREQIAFRAYELHLAGHGDDVANWFRAEKELAAA